MSLVLVVFGWLLLHAGAHLLGVRTTHASRARARCYRGRETPPVFPGHLRGRKVEEVEGDTFGGQLFVGWPDVVRGHHEPLFRLLAIELRQVDSVVSLPVPLVVVAVA